MPFTGKTGWKAFASHCPKDGNIILLYAPHVGVDEHGTVGSVAREGQDHKTSACGAAKAGLQAGKDDAANCSKPVTEMYDYQMASIKHLLVPHVKKI